jgi:hypothetical protein
VIEKHTSDRNALILKAHLLRMARSLPVQKIRPSQKNCSGNSRLNDGIGNEVEQILKERDYRQRNKGLNLIREKLKNKQASEGSQHI